MNLKAASLAGLVAALAGILFLLNRKLVFSSNPYAIAIQIFAALLMLWARITFGLRSFHATANTTKGGLVRTGPYRFLRHPIYAALIYFFWACVISFPYLETIAAVVLITLGLVVRMLLEEKFLKEEYPEYLSYSKQTKRVIPFVF